MSVRRASSCITGVGVITPFGIGLDALQKFYRRFLELEANCLRYTAGLPRYIDQLGGRQYFPEKVGIDYLSKSSLCVCIGSRIALENAGLELEKLDKRRIGVVVGSAFASANPVNQFSHAIRTDGPDSIDPIAFPNTVSNAPAGYLASLYGLMGLNITFSSGVISSALGLDYACDVMNEDLVDVVIVGGVEELVQDKTAGDREDAEVVEGCSMLVVEDLDDAKQRGARILGYLYRENSRGLGGAHASGHLMSRREEGKPFSFVDPDQSHATGHELMERFTLLFEGASTAVGLALSIALELPNTISVTPFAHRLVGGTGMLCFRSLRPHE